MRKRLLHLFSALCFVGLAANAEVIQNYEYNFDDETIKNTSYHPFGWGRMNDQGTYVFEDNGRSEKCLTISQYQDSDGWYDFLVVPPFTGAASVWVRANSSDGSIRFRLVTDKSTNREDFWNSTWITDFETPELVVGEWVKVDLPPCEAGKRIGIRVHNASIDDFFAESADISAYEKLTIGNVSRVGSGDLYGDAEGKFEIEYNITLANNGEVSYSRGNENYTLSHYFGNGTESIGEIEIPESLAPGESKTMNIKVSLEGGDAKMTDNIRIVENISNSEKSSIRVTFVPYLPEIKLYVSGTLNEYYSSPYKFSEPYAPYLSFGNVYDQTRREKAVTIKNTASKAPLTITAITATGEGFGVDFTENYVIEAGSTQDFTIKFDGAEPGIYRGSLTIETAELGSIVSPLAAAVPDADKWHEGFEGEGNPAGFILSDNAEITNIVSAFGGEGHQQVLSLGGTSGEIITPKLQVSEGETLLISGYSGFADATFTVEYSADRNDWTEVYNTRSADFSNKFSIEDFASNSKLPGFVEVSGIPEGEWYVRISGTYLNIDDLYGFTAIPLGNELYLRASTIPSRGKDNTLYEAKVEIVNLGSDVTADDYAVKLYFDETVFAVAESVDLVSGESKEFVLAAVPHETGEYEARIEVEMGEQVWASDAVTVTIGEESSSGETLIVGPSTGSSDGGPVYKGTSRFSEILYTKAHIEEYTDQLLTDSKINSISFYGRYWNDYSVLPAVTSHVTLYMKNDSALKLTVDKDNSDYWTTYYKFGDTSSMQKVFEGDITIEPQTSGTLFTLDLDEPFVYTGDGIDIQFVSSVESGSTSSPIYYNAVSKYDNGRIAYSTAESFLSFGKGSSYIPTIGFGLAADVAVVSGTVTHATSKEPLADVAITLESPENVIYRTVTDENGEYTVNVLQPDKQYKVKASKDKLDDYESEEYLDLSGLSATHHFTMSGVTTGVESIQAGTLKVNVVAGGIAISAENEADVAVYDLLGRAVIRLEGFTGEKRISLPAGIYVVNNRKVAVK